MKLRSILKDLATAYYHANIRFERAAHRGDFDRADEYMSEMQEIERCFSVHEISTAWRRTLNARLQKEGAR